MKLTLDTTCCISMPIIWDIIGTAYYGLLGNSSLGFPLFLAMYSWYISRLDSSSMYELLRSRKCSLRQSTVLIIKSAQFRWCWISICIIGVTHTHKKAYIDECLIMSVVWDVVEWWIIHVGGLLLEDRTALEHSFEVSRIGSVIEQPDKHADCEKVY